MTTVLTSSWLLTSDAGRRVEHRVDAGSRGRRRRRTASSSSIVRPSGRATDVPASPRTAEATGPWSSSEAPPATTIAAYCVNATAPTPNTLPVSSWNGVAALSTTSITRDDFSSTTLIAIQLPYMMMIMKIRMVMPKASMSWPIAAAVVSRIGSVRAGSGHCTSNVGRREQRGLIRGRDAEALEAVGDGDRVRALLERGRRSCPSPMSLVYSVNSSSPCAARSIPSTAEYDAVHGRRHAPRRRRPPRLTTKSGVASVGPTRRRSR